MKRFFYALMMVLACELACSVIPSATPAFEAQAASKGSMVYYVVVGSYSSLQNAIEYNRTCPDGMEGSVIETYSDGRTLYRVCMACYYSKSRAQSVARGVGGWVLPHAGTARVVYVVTGVDGRKIRLNPS